MNICEHLTATAKLFPDKIAIFYDGQSYTYGQLNQNSAAAAATLRQAGVAPGDRVALMLPNVPAFVIWYYGALRLGAIAVSISTRMASSEAAFVLRDCESKAFVTSQEAAAEIEPEMPTCVDRIMVADEFGATVDEQPFDQLDSLAASSWFDADPHDPALILYTSGTTGFAKGATLSHNNVRTNVCAFNHLCGMQSDDRMLLAVPLFHCFGQNALLNSALNVGATLVLQKGFDLQASKRLITEHRVTQLYAVPTMFQLLHECCAREDLTSLRYCFSAAAKLPKQVIERWQEKFGLPIYEGYGLTETSPFASYNHRLRYVAGSIGTPIDGVEMKIVDNESGESLPPGELGEIAIRGPNVMLGYWNRPDDTAAAIRDGWFYSGDIGRMSDDGFYYIVDRVKDMIAVGGLKVFPAEVERILLDHSSVSQAAVVGLPDEVLGEQVVAFVVPTRESDPATAKSILEFCRNHLASYKTPRHCQFIDELPRNPAGKVLKTKLREYPFERTMDRPDAKGFDEHQPQFQPATRPPTLWNDLRSAYASDRLGTATTFLQRLVQTILGSEETVEPEARFLEIGLDSLMIVEMSSQLQGEIGPSREVPATLLFDYPRLCDVAEYLVHTFTDLQPADNTTSSRPPAAEVMSSDQVRAEIGALSEEQALNELIRELQAE